MEQIQEWARFIVEHEELLLAALGIVVAIIGALADTLHDVVRGVESSGSATAKEGVKARMSMIRPWSMVIVHLAKTLAERQEGTK